MGRNLDEIIAEMPPERQADVEARYQVLKQEVEGLRELRLIAGKAQADIATALNIKQPSVSKIESQADMYLSTLRSYVEAIGGNLELTVKLPTRQPSHLNLFARQEDPTPKPRHLIPNPYAYSCLQKQQHNTNTPPHRTTKSTHTIIHHI